MTSLTESDVIAALARSHSAPAYAFLSHVRNGTGYTKAIRTIDALSMSLYPSRGLHLTAFEVKVSRADWLRELKDPEKSDDIFDCVDFFYLVVPYNKENPIVLEGELPKNWGLVVIQGGRAITKVQAPYHARKMDAAFLASMLRNISEGTVPKASIEGELREQFAAGERENKFQLDRANERYEELHKKVKEFEESSGVRIDQYFRNTKDIGKAVELVLANGHLHVKQNLERLLGTAESIADDLRKRLAGV